MTEDKRYYVEENVSDGVYEVHDKYALEDYPVMITANGNLAWKITDRLNMYEDILDERNERIKQLEQMNANLVKKYVIDFETKYPDYELSEGYTSTVEQDIRFEERTRKALERVERANKKGVTVDKFLQELDKW